MVYLNYGICYLKYFHPRRTLTYSKKIALLCTGK
ncbi:unknown [Alistipes sp. CAG:435]|nr:unknown [Alistipes sp. CAG:435]